MASITDLPTFDYNQIAQTDASQFMTELGAKHSLIRLTSDNPDHNVILVIGANTVVKVFGDPESFSNTGHPQSRRFDSDVTPETNCIYARAGLDLKNIAVWSDGAYHSRVRKLIQSAFSVPEVNRKAEYISEIINDSIDNFYVEEAVDVVPYFANVVPTRVITREFGLEDNLFGLMRSITDTVSIMTDTMSNLETTAEAAPIIIRLQQMLLEKLDRVGDLPETSLLRQLAEARTAGEPALSRSELMWLATLILAAGGHTTAGMIAWSAYMLAEHPDIQQRVRNQPDLADRFVEETLRLHGPVPSMFRRATRDSSLDGVEIPKGTNLVVRTDAVNFDPNRWDEPGIFNIDRPGIRNHSTFGSPKHFCIGNALARKEIVLCVQSLVRRFSRISCVEHSPPAMLKSFDAHMLSSLPLRLTV